MKITEGLKQECIDKGYELGVEEGFEKGVHVAKVFFIIELLKKNVDITLISDMTDISVEDIKKFKSENGHMLHKITYGPGKPSVRFKWHMYQSN